MAFIQMDYMAESIQRWTTSWVLFPMQEEIIKEVSQTNEDSCQRAMLSGQGEKLSSQGAMLPGQEKLLSDCRKEKGTLTAVILLHDAGGNHTDFVTKYGAYHAAEKSGLILIMPDLDNSECRDIPVYGANYETYIAKELPSLMRKAFPIGKDKEHLVLMGVGEGGKAALRIAEKFPDVFGRAADVTEGCKGGAAWL